MFIKSKDGKSIINLNNVFGIRLVSNVIYADSADSDENAYYIVGTYENEADAKKMFDKIWEIFQNNVQCITL